MSDTHPRALLFHQYQCDHSALQLEQFLRPQKMYVYVIANQMERYAPNDEFLVQPKEFRMHTARSL